MDHKQASFLQVVEILHGASPTQGKDPNGNQMEVGGLWDELVKPRPSVLRHDLSAEDRAVFKLCFAQGYGQYRSLDNMEVVVTLVDYDYSKRQSYPRHKLMHPTLMADGHVCIGTRRLGGAWRVVDMEDPKYGAVVDGVHRGNSKVAPVGLSRRADRTGGSFCLVTGKEPTLRERRLAGKVLAMLEEAKEKKIGASSSMPGFQFFVADSSPFVMRSEDEVFPEAVIAKRRLNLGIAAATATGRWGIAGVPNMICDMVGTISAVDGFNVTVDGDNGSKQFSFDPAVANAIAVDRSGLDLPYVQPLVQRGQKVMPGMALFGPWPVQRLDNPNDVPGLIAGLGGDLELMAVRIRAWYILANAKELDNGRLGYPIEFVVPRSLKDVYMRADEMPHIVAKPAEDSTDQYSRVIPVRKCLKAGGIGFEVDLYEDSTRMQMIEDITRPKTAPLKSPVPSTKSKARV